MDANRNPAVHRGVHRAEKVRKGFTFGTQLGVQHRHLDRRFRHAVAVKPAKRTTHVRGNEGLTLEEWRQEVVHEHMLCSFHVLG